jgi:sporulation protein YtfJ
MEEKMQPHPIETIMKTTMEELKEMVDVNTIVGDAVASPDGSVIVPLSKVSFGFVAGGGEYGEPTEESTFSFGGGSGAGVCVNPVAFLVVGKDDVHLLPVENANTLDRVFELVPRLMKDVKDIITNGVSGNHQTTSTVYPTE